jgi:peroxiredoxin
VLALAKELKMDPRSIPTEIEPDFLNTPPADGYGPWKWGPFKISDLGPPPLPESLLPSKGQSASLVVFNLGASCRQCNVQLSNLARFKKDFADLKIKVTVVTRESKERVDLNFQNPEDKEFEGFQFIADPTAKAFAWMGAYDEFEAKAMHGIFLIDPAGNILWREVDKHPFREIRFLVGEAKRLLSFSGAN